VAFVISGAIVAALATPKQEREDRMRWEAAHSEIAKLLDPESEYWQTFSDIEWLARATDNDTVRVVTRIVRRHDHQILSALAHRYKGEEDGKSLFAAIKQLELLVAERVRSAKDDEGRRSQ
jgi:hypothetical protein